MINDQAKPTGELHIVLTDENGNVKQEQTIHNLVVTAGKQYIASRMAGTTSGVMTHMALGSSTSAASLTDTDLLTLVGARVALTSATLSGSSVTYVGTFGPGVSTGAITEAGIFNASTAGTMLARTVFSVVNKAAGDTLSISWSVSIN
jgi:hypothetical protein